MMTFQQLILTLQNYWAEKGCVVLQPYDMEMGAGTFHTATFLRALGPERWHAAYVQPSRRPTDGRYGDNPNRLQHYYQFQVVLKPNPPDIQELYLGSLKAIGIDTLTHDVRFVEDNWESPTLGAWGLGWEVWLNGMEVTQFTYFQQVGGIECFPVTGEITYGLERLAMYIQGVDSVYDLVWTDGEFGRVTYGDVFNQNDQPTTLNMPMWQKCLSCLIFMKAKPINWSVLICRFLHMKWCLKRHIPLTCWMRVGRFPSLSVSALSCVCAPWRVKWHKAM